MSNMRSIGIPTSRIFCIKQSSDLVNYTIFVLLRVMKTASTRRENRFMNFGKAKRPYAWIAKISVIEVLSSKDIFPRRSPKASLSRFRNVAATKT